MGREKEKTHKWHPIAENQSQILKPFFKGIGSPAATPHDKPKPRPDLQRSSEPTTNPSELLWPGAKLQYPATLPIANIGAYPSLVEVV